MYRSYSRRFYAEDVRDEMGKWIKVLTVAYLIATFEHNYATLHLYSAHITFLGIDVSTLTSLLLVLALDLSTYFSIYFIVKASSIVRTLLPARIILIFSSAVSIVLNVKYMLDYAPDGLMSAMIGVVVGVLVPSMLILLGWLEGSFKPSSKDESDGTLSSPPSKTNPQIAASSSPPQAEATTSVKKRQHTRRRDRLSDEKEAAIIKYIKEHHRESNRSIARRFDVSHTTIGRLRRTYNI